MKQRDLLIIGIFILLALFAGWYWGFRYAHIDQQQQVLSYRLVEIESRILPLEQDHSRRKKIRSKAKQLMGWFCSKIGF
jgi:hypothetical protein